MVQEDPTKRLIMDEVISEIKCQLITRKFVLGCPAVMKFGLLLRREQSGISTERGYVLARKAALPLPT